MYPYPLLVGFSKFWMNGGMRRVARHQAFCHVLQRGHSGLGLGSLPIQTQLKIDLDQAQLLTASAKKQSRLLNDMLVRIKVWANNLLYVREPERST